MSSTKSKKPMFIPSLSEREAMKLGASLISEILMSAMGAGIFYLFYQRQKRQEAEIRKLTKMLGKKKTN